MIQILKLLHDEKKIMHKKSENLTLVVQTSEEKIPICLKAIVNLMQKLLKQIQIEPHLNNKAYT